MVQVLCPIVVGRDAELQELQTRLREAQAGTGSAVLVTGEAGIGKSRLTREILATASALGMTVALGRATPTGRAGAYRPLTEALLQALRVRPVLDDPILEPWLPWLGGIVPVPEEGATPIGSNAPIAVRGEAIAQLLGRVADTDGLVLALEDLHWADPDTVALAEYVADNCGGSRLLMICTVRSGEPSAALDLVRRRRADDRIGHLELTRLGSPFVADMVRACLPGLSRHAADRIELLADGVPLLVEELLASPGVPSSFAESVRERLARFDSDGRTVLEAAAVLGRRFDWRLLAPITGLHASVIDEALGLAVERLLLELESDGYRFRHALTREAVLSDVPPNRRVALSAGALSAVKHVHPDLEGSWGSLAADLASLAGDRAEAAALLTAAGQADLARGALATAIETLRRAMELDSGRIDTLLSLVEALAMAGRVDEATAATRHSDPLPADSVRLHLRLAQAAVAADRWQMATEQIGRARKAAAGGDVVSVEPSLLVLEAEVALSVGNEAEALARAEAALAATKDPAVRCQAYEVKGRIARQSDHLAAEVLFRRALDQAEAGGLPIWRTRALHELGTIDLLEQASPDRLLQARDAAARLGALSTVAVIDLQLAATRICRWEPVNAMADARSCSELAELLGLDEVREKAILFMAEASAQLGSADEVETYLAAAGAPGKKGQVAEGYCWAFRGEVALVNGDLTSARRDIGAGIEILARLAHREPAAFRATWPLLLAAAGDPRAADELADARRWRFDVFNLNRGIIGYAEAVLAGHDDPARSDTLVAEADRRGFVNAATWRALARVLAAESSRTRGWGEPDRWLREGITVFTEAGLPGLVEVCRHGLAGTEPDRFTLAGITARERDVLSLVGEGLP
ncbi:MAG TPA: AAA family ATPase, partial [Acidimicrobiales bacterium]|nr:AAA family ATPase [Acidimicrobiales bacterium]